MDEEIKNPEVYAEKEVNKRIGKEIADRKFRIRQLQAEIKKVEKEIEKIKSGELVPSGQAATITTSTFIQPPIKPQNQIYRSSYSSANLFR